MSDRWSKLTAAFAVAAIAAAVANFAYQAKRANSRPEGSIWFYNIKTHELFAASDLSVPPIDTKAGPATGVRAYVFTPDEDPNPTNRFIAFLETLTPETKKEAEADLKRLGSQAGIGFALEKRTDGILVSAPEPIEWHPKFSQEGIDIMEAGKAKGGSAHPKPSLP